MNFGEERYRVLGEMQVRVYEVMRHAVEDGIGDWWNRVNPNAAKNLIPLRALLQKEAAEAVMISINRFFDFAGVVGPRVMEEGNGSLALPEPPKRSGT